MVFIEMLQCGIAPGSQNLAQRLGLGSTAGMWTVRGLEGEGRGRGRRACQGPEGGGNRQLLIAVVLLLWCVLSPCLL